MKQLATVSARPELIVTSPLSRATQTAVIGFRDLISAGALLDNFIVGQVASIEDSCKLTFGFPSQLCFSSSGVPIVAHEDCRERFGAHFCDYRRPVDDLMYDFPQVSYEFLDVVEDPYRGEFFDGALMCALHPSQLFFLRCREKVHADCLFCATCDVQDHRERYSSVAARAYRFLEFLRARFGIDCGTHHCMWPTNVTKSCSLPLV